MEEDNTVENGISSLGGLFFTEVLDLKNILGFSTFLSIPIVRVLRSYIPQIK